MGNNDKPAALLTNKQRKYLKGKESVTPSYERNLRDNIHDRIEATMGDFVTLFDELDQEDVREAFGNKFASRIGVDDDKLGEALKEADDPSEIDHETIEEDIPEPRETAANAHAVIAFLLQGLNYEDEPIHEAFEEMPGQQQPAFRDFIEVVEQGIQKYLNQETNYVASVSVNIELNDLQPIDDLIEESDE